ncbi:MAG: nitroreductase [Sphaerobacteraceae bacterium]|nr:MAG: nitroreductase [Sphaerobacteraceae bacterium]
MKGNAVTITSNAILDAINNRRSVGKVTEEIPPTEHIQTMLEAAITAPNHHHTEPWRFFVLTGDARLGLGDALVEDRLSGEEDPSSIPEAVIEKTRQKPLRAPVVIGVAVQPQQRAKVWEVEEVCSTAAAIQNMLLAAHSLGLATMWRTGDPCYSEPVKQFFGLGEEDTLLGMIYVGYPASEPAARNRTPVDQVTTWWDS